MSEMQCMNFPDAYACQEEEADVEDAIVSVGEAEGPFDEVDGIAIERDPQFPVRVTLQVHTTAHAHTHTHTHTHAHAHTPHTADMSPHCTVLQVDGERSGR
jgi:hypothetical protein